MKKIIRELIEELELELRKLIKKHLQHKYATRWLEILKENMPEKEIEGYIKDKFKSHNELIDYTNIGTLRNIILKDTEWQDFKKIFNEKQLVEDCINPIVRVRNALAHPKNLPLKELKRAEVCCEDILDLINPKWKELLKEKRRKVEGKRRKVILLSIGSVFFIVGLFSLGYLCYQKTQKTPVIEVSPFKNLNNDAQLDYLSGTLAEVIKNKLARSGQLFVVDTHSVENFGNSLLINNAYATERKEQEISKNLGINFLINGSFIKAGDKVKIIANVVDVNKNKVINSTEYEGEWSDSEILNIQNKIAYKIIEVLNISILPSQKESIERVLLPNPAAYKYFSKTWDLFLTGNYQEVILFCKKALEVDLEYLDVYKRLGNAYDAMGDSDSALNSYQEYARLSEQKGDLVNLANAFINIGWIYHNRGEYEKAFEFYNKGIIQSVDINDKLHEAKAYRQLASWYIDKGEYEKALSLLLKSSKINKEKVNIYDYKFNLACDYQELGILFSYKKDYDKALKYFLKSLSFLKSFGAERQVNWLKERISDRISDNYTNLGDTYFNLKNYNKALFYYNKGLEIDKLIDWQEGLAGDYRCLGTFYVAKNDFNTAMTYYDKSLEIFSKNKDEIGLGSVYRELGLLYYKKREYDRALSYLGKTLLIYEKENFPEAAEIKQEINDAKQKLDKPQPISK